MLEDPYGQTAWAFESIIGTPVAKFEYSNPESEDSHLESEYFTPFMMASNLGATSTVPYISQDSSYHSGYHSRTTNPFNYDDRFVYDLDDGKWKYAPILSRSQVESSNSPKTAEKPTSSSTSFRPQIPSPRSSDGDSAYASHCDFGNQKESWHVTENATSNDRPTSSSSSGKHKLYCCVFPLCEAAFARPYDLGRHQRSRHVNSKRYDCPEETCRRFGVPMATNERGGFTRLDHFRDHVKNLHGKIVIKDKNSPEGQYWVKDPEKSDGGLWMRDETGSILMKDHNGRIQVKDAITGRWYTRDR